MNTLVGTQTGRMFHIPKGNEPMVFSPEFTAAVGRKVAEIDLQKVEERVAKEICQKADKQFLASQ